MLNDIFNVYYLEVGSLFCVTSVLLVLLKIIKTVTLFLKMS